MHAKADDYIPDSARFGATPAALAKYEMVRSSQNQRVG